MGCSKQNIRGHFLYTLSFLSYWYFKAILRIWNNAIFAFSESISAKFCYTNVVTNGKHSKKKQIKLDLFSLLLGRHLYQKSRFSGYFPICHLHKPRSNRFPRLTVDTNRWKMGNENEMNGTNGSARARKVLQNKICHQSALQYFQSIVIRGGRARGGPETFSGPKTRPRVPSQVPVPGPEPSPEIVF